MSMRTTICQGEHAMAGSLFICLPRVCSVAPSRAFPQARLDYLASLLSCLLCLCFCERSSLPFPEEVCRQPPAHAGSLFSMFLRSVALGGFELVPGIVRFGILCIETTGSVCVESLCHVFSALPTFQLSSPLLNSPIGFVL